MNPASVRKLVLAGLVSAVVGGAAKLRAEKGINLPETELDLPALTAKDVEDLAFVAKHADMVALSFVQRPEDIEALLAELARLDASRLGIVLKIETQAAFKRLPMLLLAAAGLDLARLIVVRCRHAADQQWAYEQALRAPECGAAFAWLDLRDDRALRRLAVAAREGDTWGVLWRRPGRHATAAAAPLRLALSPQDGKLAVRVLKRRGGDLAQPVVIDVDAPPDPRTSAGREIAERTPVPRSFRRFRSPG